MTNNALELIRTACSRRSFVGSEPLADSLLTEIAEALRFSPSAGNKQTLRLMLLTDESDCQEIFPLTRWAGYLKDGSPKEGHRPTAYAILIHDASRGQLSQVDVGIAAQNINLVCVARGFACCMIGAFDKTKVAQRFLDNEALTPELIVAIGMPDETVVVEDMPSTNSDVKYWRTADGTHHVPKRSLEDLTVRPNDSRRNPIA